MTRTTIKNALVGIGAYWISWWVSIPLSIPYAYLTNRIHYYGEFEGHVMLPIVLSIPIAIVAAGVGALTVWIVDSIKPVRWAIVPALLFFASGFKGRHWLRPPEALDRVEQIIGAAFPAAVCLIGAFVAERYLRKKSR